MKKLYLFPFLIITASLTVSAQNISINTTGAANSTLSMLEVLQISTTANTKGLHVSHSGAITGIGYGVWSEVTGGSTTNIAGYFNATGGATNNYALIVPSGGGKIGIGTATPDATRVLTVQGSGAASEMIALKNTTGTTTWHINAAGGADNLNFAETFVADGRLYLEAGGNIGLGITDPTSLLHLHASAPTLTFTHSTGVNQNNTGVIYFSEDATSGMKIRYDGSNNDLRIVGRASSADTDLMTIERTGEVGIGTSAPSADLHVVNSGTASHNIVQFLAPNLSTTEATFLKLGKALSNGDQADIMFNWTGTNNAANYLGFSFYGDPIHMAITNAGNVGIGTTSPGYKLELSTNSAGKPTSGSWTISSDARLKNIEGKYQKGLKEILQLQPITYHYKNVGNKKFSEEVLNTLSVGLSAQEVQKIFPEAVGAADDGYLNLDMHSILVAYINAFKEQQALINALQKQNENLLLRVEKLETRLHMPKERAALK